MTDVNYSVPDGSSDGHTSTVSPFNIRATEYIYIGSARQDYFRFTGVAIPAGSTVTSAYVKFRSWTGQSSTAVNLNVHFEDSDNTSAFAATAQGGQDILDAPLTTGTSWNGVGTWVTNSYYDTPDISADLQEVIDRVGWSSGNAVTVHIADNGSTASAHRRAVSYDNGNPEPAELFVTYEDVGPVVDAFSISDTVDAFNTSDDLPDQFAIADTIDASLLRTEVEEVFSFSDSVDAQNEYPRDFSDTFSFSDTVEAFSVFERDLADVFDFSDTIDAFNYTHWLRDNFNRIQTRYYFTLTGTADSTTDIEIPISSFSARKRNGERTYLSVVIPGFTYAADIATRPSGEMILEIGYLIDGVVSLREQIVTGTYEEIRVDEGGENRSITLTGRKSIEYHSNLITLSRDYLSYRSVQGGVRVFRFARIDPYLNPSDSVVIGEEALTCDNINYVMGQTGTTMEVREGG